MWLDIVFAIAEFAVDAGVELLFHGSKHNEKLSLARKAELDIRLRHPKELQRLLRDKQKIQAVKLYRDETKASLKEAKLAVEMMQDEMLVARHEARLSKGSPANLEEVQHFLQMGNKIQAIKAYRKSTGAGLREAKEAVDMLAVKWSLG